MTSRLAVVPELERELDELYARPLDEFTNARNELVRRLRSAGQAEAAERVKALKKPSVPLWAVNQLARRHPDQIETLVASGEQLRKAQAAAFRGDVEAVRRATTVERRIARDLTRRATELLAKGARPATRPVMERIAALLRAAALDPAVGRLLAAGRLTEEVHLSGFEALGGIPAPKRRPGAAARPSVTVDRRREERLRRLRDRLADLEQSAAAAEKEAKAAERAAERARAAADRAAAAVERTGAELSAADRGPRGSAA